MKDFDIWCPTCKKEFQGEQWESGHCPFCNRYYSWDEYYSEESGDCIVSIDWDWSENVNNSKTSY